MATKQDLHTVRGLSEEYELVESVRLEGGEIVVRGDGVTERFATAEEACSALRSSWRFVGPSSAIRASWEVQS